MPCTRCIESIQAAAAAIRELAYCDPDRLPPDLNWRLLNDQLVNLAGHLRRRAPTDNLEDGVSDVGRTEGDGNAV